MDNAMDISQKQILRGRILKICHQAEPLGAGTEVITAALKREGYPVSKDEVGEACRYLAGKKLVEIEKIENKVLNISRDIAHITARGTDVLDGTIPIEGIEL